MAAPTSVIRVPYFLDALQQVRWEMYHFMKQQNPTDGDVVKTRQVGTSVDPDGWPVMLIELKFVRKE